jgi:hypothetical protein
LERVSVKFIYDIFTPSRVWLKKFEGTAEGENISNFYADILHTVHTLIAERLSSKFVTLKPEFGDTKVERRLYIKVKLKKTY